MPENEEMQLRGCFVAGERRRKVEGIEEYGGIEECNIWDFFFFAVDWKRKTKKRYKNAI